MIAYRRITMKNSLLLRVLCLGTAGFFLACAPKPRVQSGDPSLPEIDVLQLKENSDEALKLAQENKLDLQSLETKVREMESRLSSLGDELANLPVSKVDELTQQMSLMTEQLRSLEERLAKVGAGPGPKKPLATFSPTALDSGAALTKSAADTGKGSANKPGAGKTGTGKTAPAKNASENPVKPAARKPPATEGEATLYKKAFDLFYARNYDQAVIKFEEVLQKYPASTYADNCAYWIGECHFANGNFQKAIASFRKVFTFPETEKADDAQLKLGYCYLRLGDKKQAALEFKKVVSLYPDSEYTERAKEELAKLE